jgi:hypothetical protein
MIWLTNSFVSRFLIYSRTEVASIFLRNRPRMWSFRANSYGSIWTFGFRRFWWKDRGPCLGDVVTSIPLIHFFIIYGTRSNIIADFWTDVGNYAPGHVFKGVSHTNNLGLTDTSSRNVLIASNYGFVTVSLGFQVLESINRLQWPTVRLQRFGDSP